MNRSFEKAKYRGFFTQSILGMFERTPDGKISKAHASFLRLLGYTSFDRIFNLDFMRDVYGDSNGGKNRIKVLDVRLYIRNIEVQVKRKNGKILTVLEYARTLRDSSGTMIGIEGTLEDVTTKKAIEQKAKLKRLGIVPKNEKGIQILSDFHETNRFI